MLTKKKSAWIKSYAILMIVLHHVSIWTDMLTGGVKVYFQNMGACNVTLFLALSGYGLTASWKNDCEMKCYWKNKLEKIYFPYVLVTFFWLFFCFDRPLSGKIVLLNILCINVDKNYTLDSTMWYLTFLLFWYLSFYLVMRQKIGTYFKVFCLLVLGFLTSSMWNVPEETAWFAQVIRWSSFGFPLGIVLYFVGEKINFLINKDRYKKILWGISGCVALVAFYYFYYTYPFTDYVYEITGILWTVGVIGIFQWIPIQEGVSLFTTNKRRALALIPYLIYLLENKVLQYTIKNQFNLGTYLLLLVLAAFLVAMLIDRVQRFDS